MTPVTTKEVRALAEWDTPALSNALDTLRLRPHNAGHSDGTLVRLTGRSRMVGTAVTARMVARHPGEDGIPVSRLHALIDDGDGPIVVVVEDCDDPPGAGAFLGEVNGSLLAALKIAAFVTNGRVRDITELRQFNYPVYAQGLCVARSNMRLIEVGTVVTVGGITIHPGDILHGDEHGVLQIPPEALPEIVAKAELIRGNEQNVVGWSRSAEFTVEGLLALKRVRH
jgi:4-hydroxy-4-methyl-2-oxoglutarate aldolase